MTQLIINGTTYPQTSRDQYKCYKRDIGKTVRMAAGNMVTELRGQYRIIEYAYDYFSPELMQTCLTDLRSGEELSVYYLPDGSNTLEQGVFRCTELPAPTFAFGRNDTAYWHDVRFVLEETTCD